jgi:hypothetical protein
MSALCGWTAVGAAERARACQEALDGQDLSVCRQRRVTKGRRITRRVSQAGSEGEPFFAVKR